MIVSKNLKDRCQARSDECIKIAEAHYNRTFPKLTISYAKRGSTAGVAHLGKDKISLNGQLLVENEDEMINETTGHEVAHMIDFWVNGVNYYWKGNRRCQDQHGENWKSVMRLIGQDPTRCHDMDVSSVRIRKGIKYIWTCGCPTHIEMEIGQKRHDRKLANPAGGVYTRRHKRCGYTFTAMIKNGKRIAVDSKLTTIAVAAAKKMTDDAFDMSDIYPTPKPTPKPKRKTGGKSKLTQCREIFSEKPYLTRFALITLFVVNANCTKAGAATYYAKIKNERTSIGWAA